MRRIVMNETEIFLIAMMTGCLSSDRPDDFLVLRSQGEERLVSVINSDTVRWLEISERAGTVRIGINPLDCGRVSRPEEFKFSERSANFTSLFVRVFGNFVKAGKLNPEGRKVLSLLPDPSLAVLNDDQFIDLLWFVSPVQDSGLIVERQRSMGQILEAEGFKSDHTGWDITFASVPVAGLIAKKHPTLHEIVGEDPYYRPSIVMNSGKKWKIEDFPVVPPQTQIILSGNQAVNVD